MDQLDLHCPYLLSSETTAKGTGLAKSAGKEDPVELDSSLAFANTNHESVAYRSFSCWEYSAWRCQKSYHRDNWLVAAKRLIATLLFDPSMSALPII
ncbi:UNVERIFIED_CONTAM: hypothetical protein B566_EDAN018920 [Ephemera danica]|nr:hypothetical protein B566_EDAN018920 [Ephemera danica]